MKTVQKLPFLLSQSIKNKIASYAKPGKAEIDSLAVEISKELMLFISKASFTNKHTVSLFGEWRNIILESLQTIAATTPIYFQVSKAIDQIPFNHFCAIIKEIYIANPVYLSELGIVIDKVAAEKFNSSSVYIDLQKQVRLWLFSIDKFADVLQRTTQYQLIANEFLEQCSPYGADKHWKLSIKSTYGYALRNSMLYIGAQIAKQLSGRVSKLVLSLESYSLPYLFSNVLMYLIGQKNLIFGFLIPACTSIAIAASSYLSGSIISLLGNKLESKYALSDFNLYIQTIIKARKKLKDDIKVIVSNTDACLANASEENIIKLKASIAESFKLQLISKYEWKEVKEECYLDNYYKEYITESGWLNITKMDQSEIETIEKLQQETNNSIRAKVLSEYNTIVDHFKL